MEDERSIVLGVSDTPLNLMDLLYPTVFFLKGLKLIKWDQIDDKNKDKGPNWHV